MITVVQLIDQINRSGTGYDQPLPAPASHSVLTFEAEASSEASPNKEEARHAACVIFSLIMFGQILMIFICYRSGRKLNQQQDLLEEATWSPSCD